MISFDQDAFLQWVSLWEFRGYFDMFAGLPHFESYEEMCDYFATFGMILPESPPNSNVYLCTRTLMIEAKTLRERCFAYLFNGITPDNEISLHPTHIKKHPIKPFRSTCRSLMAACYRDKEICAALRNLPITRSPISSSADPEIEGALQDLADIVTWEAHQAFISDYYPCPIEVQAMTDDEVDTVMWAMQREINREGSNRNKRPPKYVDLPRERQIALAERRRYWFEVFGITPESWKTGRWSLWKVKNIRPPEGPKYMFKVPPHKFAG